MMATEWVNLEDLELALPLPADVARRDRQLIKRAGEARDPAQITTATLCVLDIYGRAVFKRVEILDHRDGFLSIRDMHTNCVGLFYDENVVLSEISGGE